MGNKIILWFGLTFFALTLTLSGCGKKEEPAAPAPAEQAAPEGGSSEGAAASAPEGGEAAPANPCAAAPQPEKTEEGAKTN